MKDRVLFNTCPDGEFFGRQKEIDYVFERASGELKAAPNILLFGKRWMGKTEVLRRVHRDLFWGQARVAPVYYQFKGYAPSDNFAEDYLKEVLRQYLAFRKRETSIVSAEIPLDGLERLLIDGEIFDLADLVARHREAKRGADHVAALRNAITAPAQIAHRSGLPVYLILDDVGLASSVSLYKEGPGMMREFMEALSSAHFLAASSARKSLEGGVLNGSVEALTLEGLDVELSVSMMSELCRRYGIEYDAEILTLAADKLEGNPMYMKNIVWAAHRSGRELVILKDFADLYANELTEGNIGFALRSAISIRGVNDLRVLNACSCLEGPTSEEELAERFRYGHQELKRTISELASSGLLDVNLGSIRWAGDGVARDFISSVYETRIKGRSTEEVRTLAVRDCLKMGFSFKGALVRSRLKEEVSSALRSFDGQKVLKVLLRNPVFSARFKNGAYSMVENKKEEDEVALPQVAGCFESSRLEKGETGAPIVIAHGFQNNRYDAGNEVVWLVSVKEASVPVNLGDVENFIRRAQLLKENFRTTRVVRWMVGREGFTGEAQKRLDAEGVYSTDPVQLRILKDSIMEKDPAARQKAAGTLAPNKEFEIVLPMSTKAELVAAKAVEEIGTEMGFGEETIGRIRAALVEACINAIEHSGTRAGKVHVRFVSSPDRLVIYVQNGGVDFDSPGAQAPRDMMKWPQKRGWGIELMKGLMDEVRFETLRGGARIVLVKYLVGKGEGGDGSRA